MTWELGQHPAIPNGWIVKPVLFGGNVRVLPECEGGHIVLRDEKAARLIAAAPELLEALEKAAPFVGWASTRGQVVAGIHADELCDAISAVIAKAKGEVA